MPWRWLFFPLLRRLGINDCCRMFACIYLLACRAGRLFLFCSATIPMPGGSGDVVRCFLQETVPVAE